MSELLRYTLKEVAQRDGNDGSRTWIVIHDNVYDVTDYKAKHPGGPELIDEYAGQDATAGFDDFGHSSDAKRTLKDFLIGQLVDEDKTVNRKKKGSSNAQTRMAKVGKRRTFRSVLCGGCA
ncbi:cytochrome b5-like [Hylaeus anthracinus]|uniref:cytochrome b5-like n=1 Tax=Hylaeus anthracinus TaxID=313031 RepID=UPI0023B8EC54|nr:cytochrome b5-like [Hylaeus anthracinus]